MSLSSPSDCSLCLRVIKSFENAFFFRSQFAILSFLLLGDVSQLQVVDDGRFFVRNDFIYSIIIEEYGLLGGAFMIFIYLVFLFRCIRIFRRCPYAFGAFLALGLSFTLAIQAVANMAVNVNIVPVTGVTLPLVSMGGSSFIFTCCSIGLILSVARNVEQLEGKAPEETDIEIPNETDTVQNDIQPTA